MKKNNLNWGSNSMANFIWATYQFLKSLYEILKMLSLKFKK